MQSACLVQSSGVVPDLPSGSDCHSCPRSALTTQAEWNYPLSDAAAFAAAVLVAALMASLCRALATQQAADATAAVTAAVPLVAAVVASFF